MKFSFRNLIKSPNSIFHLQENGKQKQKPTRLPDTSPDEEPEEKIYFTAAESTRQVGVSRNSNSHPQPQAIGGRCSTAKAASYLATLLSFSLWLIITSKLLYSLRGKKISSHMFTFNCIENTGRICCSWFNLSSFSLLPHKVLPCLPTVINAVLLLVYGRENSRGSHSQIQIKHTLDFTNVPNLKCGLVSNFHNKTL